jgi:hypothetical protein
MHKIYSMKNHAVVCDCRDVNHIYCVDPYLKTFPVYKHFFSGCQILPKNKYPSKCFSIKSYHLAVKSQQLGIIGSKRNCSEENKAISCYCMPPDPCKGFQLIEYADKCCSELELPVKDNTNKKCISKAVVTDCCHCCDKSINCNMIAVACLPSKVICLPPPSKPSCLKSKPSSVGVHMSCLKNKSSCTERKSSCKEMVLCRKCREKKNKKKMYEKCHCKSGSVVYYHRNCNYVKDKHGKKCTDESFSKLECDKQKCKYLDLIHRIKCIFTKDR